MILNRLKRIDSKINQLSMPEKDPDQTSKTEQATIAPVLTPSQGDIAQFLSPPPHVDIQKAISSTGSPHTQSKLSFSAHQAIHWPGLHSISLSRSFATGAEGSNIYLSDVELDGPSYVEQTQNETFSKDWLATLSLSTVKGLCNAYFVTFNRVFPLIDRDHFFLDTLSTVVAEGFSYDIESCLVLSVMALGCLGSKAYDEGGYPSEDSLPSTGVVQILLNQDVPGQQLFDESRRRIGLCSSAKDIRISQYYLTAALFFSQAMLPLNQWMMTDRASTNCLIFWHHIRHRSDEWTVDMQARVFWSSLLMETVIVQEMDLPRSRLRELENIVPLPTFMVYPNAKRQQQALRGDESYYHYHFLAQIAHRIILVRIRDEMYHFNPSVLVANELRHQLEQWRANLPPALQFNNHQHTFSCPAEAVAMSLLQTRYRSAIYHVGRPFLYKALANPSSISDQELNFCSEALQNASDWPIATGSCQRMSSFSPLKYFVCRSFFGTLLISYALRESGNERLVKTLPDRSDVLCSDMLRYIEDLAVQSPSLRKDREFLSLLYGPPND
ncbi:hypothetical protein LTR84_011910 [Exophiala bonariae]|uniref:Transcription factor domain-containing protein n=1 Tax=Exophiala bonariae TaxID=1690606 RepID=A0AAV9NKZ4_9EURO|nr:hypothetical protein LTR84_011910 [Exophiala bonariae]